jgi:hypothetical protein
LLVVAVEVLLELAVLAVAVMVRQMAASTLVVGAVALVLQHREAVALV